MIPYRARVCGRYVGLKRTKAGPIEAVHTFEEVLGAMYELVPYDTEQHLHGIAHAGEVYVRGALRPPPSGVRIPGWVPPIGFAPHLMINRSQSVSTAGLDLARMSIEQRQALGRRIGEALRDRLTPRIPS